MIVRPGLNPDQQIGFLARLEPCRVAVLPPSELDSWSDLATVSGSVPLAVLDSWPARPLPAVGSPGFLAHLPVGAALPLQPPVNQGHWRPQNIIGKITGTLAKVSGG